MGWYNDNLQQYNNAQTKYTPNEQFSGAQGPGQETLSYKTNLGGKDYYYAPQQTIIGNRVGVKNLDSGTAQSLGGVPWTRILREPDNPNNKNFYSQAQPLPTTESGYLFENDPYAGKNAEYTGLKNGSWWQNEGLALAAIAAAPFAVSAGLGSAATGGAAAISGGGAMTSAAPTAGGALATPSAGASGAGGFGGSLAGSIPSYTPAMSAAGMAQGGNAALSAGSAGGSSGGMFSGLSNLFGGGGVLGTGLSGGQTLGLGMGLTDMAMRFNQQKELQDIANKSAQMANPLNDPQRQQYQQLLSQYLNGGMDITQQPIIKSEMDAMKRAAEAQMAKAGMTGSGNVGNVMSDYMLEAMNRTSQPYLNFLAGAGGFNGQGNGANVYANVAGQATGAPFQGMNSLGSALNNLTYNQPPWWSSAYNAQQQMMGRGNNSNFYGIA